MKHCGCGPPRAHCGCCPPPAVNGPTYEFTQTSTALGIPLGNPGPETTVLTLPVTVDANQTVKIDSVVNVTVVTTLLLSFEFSLAYRVYRGATLLAQGILQQRVSKVASVLNQGYFPNLTWSDVPPAGAHTYTIRLQVLDSTGLSSMTAGTRSLNMILFP
jgi:hypothetical protein